MLNPPSLDQSQNYFSRNHHSHRLPNPQELASRIEEARTSANLLSQVVQSTPPSELLHNELVREFADRCQSAQRSVQAYMVAENPSPDNDTMETLIETNEELSKAQSQHQRAVLNARKIMGVSTPTGPSPPPRTESGFAAPPGPPPQLSHPIPPTRKAVKSQPFIPPPGETLPNVSDDDDDTRNPFADPDHTTDPNTGRSRKAVPPATSTPRLDIEPYHPGFQETQSYSNKQDTSAGHNTLNAAAPVDEEPVASYGAQAGNKAPVYRF